MPKNPQFMEDYTIRPYVKQASIDFSKYP